MSLNKDKQSDGGDGPNGSCRIKGGIEEFKTPTDTSLNDEDVNELDPFEPIIVGKLTVSVACVETGSEQSPD